MKKHSIGVIWHLRDLRIEENPAVSKATKENDLLIPIYIYNESLEKLGQASLWWLENSLDELKEAYKNKGCSLIIRKGDPFKILKQLKADKIYWNHSFEPKLFKLQQKVKKHLDIDIETFNGNYLIDPREITLKNGAPYKVFTPFYKTALKHYHSQTTIKTPSKLKSPKGLKSDSLKISPQKNWIHKLEKFWKPGRKEALQFLKNFKKRPIKSYGRDRDFPAIRGTSHLSPHLHFGEISPHEIYRLIPGGESFKRQLFWREFATYFLFHFPKVEKENWNQRFDKFAWEKKPTVYKKWTKGKTGYPIIDAAMKELWETGWMHNRLRMIVASFLTKDLLIDWHKGERWFWDTLVDADLANNIFGWQWVAGTGPDAAPYFRIFNPVLQGEKFDPNGEFVKEYLPELKNLPKKWIHHPWDAPSDVLEEAGVVLGKTYPKPIFDHKKAREQALKRFAKIK